MNKIGLNIPWNRYALITKLAGTLYTRRTQFGKTALQKMVYLFQEIYKIDCGYNFELYTYGPFSSQLLHDLDFTEHMGGVVVEPVDSSRGGYKILPGKEANFILEKGKDFFNDEVNTKFSQLITDFGSFGALDLELRSTIVYVDRDLQRRVLKPGAEEDIVQVIKEIKPKFSLDEITHAIEELKNQSFIGIPRLKGR